jgi:glycerol uptake facilitator-like aquaporin
MECFAEMLGVFFYCYFGIGSTAGFVVGNILKQTGLSSLLQIGLGYACGILLALGVCFTTSGGHLSPAITLCFCIFRGFPALKAVRYIIAQVLGALIACALVYNQWKELIEAAEATLEAAGPTVFAATQFTANGPPGIFAFYLLPGQTLARVFLNEFINSALLGTVIWAALDPTNYMISPRMAPAIIALAYGAAIWGFAVPGVALNTARDVGGRIFAVAIWGSEAAGGRYAAIAALVNIPAIFVGACLYEVFLSDSDRVVTNSDLDFLKYLQGHARLPLVLHGDNGNNVHSDASSNEKENMEHVERSRV